MLDKACRWREKRVDGESVVDGWKVCRRLEGVSFVGKCVDAEKGVSMVRKRVDGESVSMSNG
jgi:hypothetical protein